MQSKLLLIAISVVLLLGLTSALFSPDHKKKKENLVTVQLTA